MENVTVAESRLAGEYPVVWTYGETGHRIVYGAECKTYSLYACARTFFESCASHAWTNYALAHGIY